MTFTRIPPLLVAGLSLAALSLAACSKPDTSALDATDAALKGQQSEGELVPIVSRVVMIGKGGANAAACVASELGEGKSAVVHWSNVDGTPPKANVTGAFAACDSDGEWTGIVFPASGQSLDACAVSGALRSPREYQGPCRWGWVKTADVKAGAA